MADAGQQLQYQTLLEASRFETSHFWQLYQTKAVANLAPLSEVHTSHLDDPLDWKLLQLVGNWEVKQALGLVGHLYELFVPLVGGQHCFCRL